MQRHRLWVAVAVITAATGVLFASSKDDVEQKEFESWILALPPEKIHEMVVSVETDPLGKTADMQRSALVTYFDKIPAKITFCINPYLPVLQSKNKLHRLVLTQALLGSGDFVVMHPDQASDSDAYLLAGLESALRAYEHIVVQKPKAKLEFLDGLLETRRQGHLSDHIEVNRCDDDSETIDVSP